MLDQKLTIEQQREILLTLFGFKVCDDGKVLDFDGFEVHNINPDSTLNLTTLRGIFQYNSEKYYFSGIRKNQTDVKNVLGIKNQY